MDIQNRQLIEGIFGERTSKRVKQIIRIADIRAEQMGLNSRFWDEYNTKRVEKIIRISDMKAKQLGLDNPQLNYRKLKEEFYN